MQSFIFGAEKGVFGGETISGYEGVHILQVCPLTGNGWIHEPDSRPVHSNRLDDSVDSDQ